MQNRDSFDDPESAGIFAGIVRALDVRHHFAARGPLWAGGMVVATAAVLGAVMYYAYPREAAQQELAAAPIIRADAGPLKMAPDDPGGMPIPHRESTVFDAVGGAPERRVESLLPPVEQPLPRAEMFAGFKTELNDAPAEAEAAADEGIVDVTPRDFDEVADYTPPVAAAPVETAKAEPTPVQAESAAKTEPAAGLSVAAREPAKGTHFVQLASVRDEAAARAEWKKLQATHNVLGPLPLHVQRADLGERGVFFRIQGGPVSEAEAREVCKAVQSKTPGGCLVVKP